MRRRLLIAVLLLPACLSLAQVRPRLEIQTTSLPSGTVGRPYSATLSANNGKGPYLWSLRGDLPAGLKLDAGTGLIAGIPQTHGIFKFATIATDRTTGASAQREITLEVKGELVLKWETQPKLNAKTISGSVSVANYSEETFDLTFIAYAVNDEGKAFALGYRRFDLLPEVQQNIPFGAELPNGHYIVHVDAVGEVPSRNIIRRSYLETPQAFAVNVNR